MTKLAIHPTTQLLIDSYFRTPAHAILLCGPVGIGSFTIAHDMAEKLGARTDDVHIITPDEKGTIAIESIRGLNTLTRSVYDAPRVIIIDDAEAMSHPAQNALLKLLEEPPKQTYFILTSHQPQLLLQTIRSRTQRIECKLLDEKISRAILDAHKAPADTHAQLLFIAQGLPAELIRLVSDPVYFQSQVALVSAARGILQADRYQRLVLIKNYTDRTQASALVMTLGRLLHFMLIRQARADLSNALETIESTCASLQANGNVRIQLTYLMMQLP